MKDARMTIRLPAGELAFAKAYARRHGLTLTGLIHHYLQRLQRSEEGDVPPQVSAIAGVVSPDLDVVDEHHSAMGEKHA